MELEEDVDGRRDMQHKLNIESKAQHGRKKAVSLIWTDSTSCKCWEAEGTETTSNHCTEWREERDNMPDVVRSFEVKAR